MTPSRPATCLIFICVPACVLACALVCVSTLAQDDLLTHMDHKQLEAMAKALVDEGKGLEKQGKLDEARDKFIDAEGYLSTKDAIDGVDRVRDAKNRKSEALLEDAQRDCSSSAQLTPCATKLETALAVGPERPAALHNNLALSYQKLGDREQAVVHLDSLIVETRDDKERERLTELRSTIIMGSKSVASTTDERKRFDGFNTMFARDTRYHAGEKDVQAESASSTSLCDRIRDIPASLSASAALVYDEAKCAEEDNDPATAAKMLTQYLQLAPDALDAHDAQLERDNFLALAALPGESGSQIRSHFTAAARDLDFRRYDRAMEEYQTAQQVAPSFALTYWRLALLSEAYGNIAMAKAYLQRYMQLETDADRRHEAAIHLNSLDQWRADYNYNATEAHDIIGDLLASSMGLSLEGVQRDKSSKKLKTSKRGKADMAASEALSPIFVRRELNQARVDLEAATELFPVGPEANEMLALLDLENNDWPSAFHEFDAVMSAGMPVSFYAQVNSSRDPKEVRAAKVEINKESVRLVYLDTYDAKKRRSEPEIRPAGDDGLGNIATSEDLLPDPGADADTFSIEELTGVQTSQNFIVLKRARGDIMLAPVYMVAFTPTEGRVAREFGNEYTRMFVRYLGYEHARLGKEGMTFGEKLKLGYTFIDTGLTIYETIQTGGLQADSALKKTIHLVRLIHSDLANLHRTVSDQHRAMNELQFKAIPSQPVELAFRDHL